MLMKAMPGGRTVKMPMMIDLDIDVETARAFLHDVLRKVKAMKYCAIPPYKVSYWLIEVIVLAYGLNLEEEEQAVEAEDRQEENSE